MLLALEHGEVSVSEMADELGVHRNTIGGYLHGRTRPSRATLRVWASVCRVSFRWLESGDFDPDDLPPNTPVTECQPLLMAA